MVVRGDGARDAAQHTLRAGSVRFIGGLLLGTPRLRQTLRGSPLFTVGARSRREDAPA